MSDRMPTGQTAPPGPGRLIAAGVVLAIAIVVPLLVWTYARTSPDLAGVPFFYWYQFLLVVVSVAMTGIAYTLVVSHEQDRRAAQGLSRRGGEEA